jgi:hypothetical protein
MAGSRKNTPIEGVGVSIWYRAPQGLLIMVCGVSIVVSVHGGSNDTIGRCVRL